MALGGLLAGSLAIAGSTTAAVGQTSGRHAPVDRSRAHYLKTATPIKHLVVIFDENVSFDHYFGTYPYATNPAGEPAFHAKSGTPTVNGLANADGPGGPTGPLLTHNGNEFEPGPPRPERPDDL